jgi:quercetin dioxygenase-like cupin family protein
MPMFPSLQAGRGRSRDWTLAPGDAFDGQIHPEGSREILYVLDGDLTLILEQKQRTPLPERTAALYTADRPRRIENETTAPARVIMVIVEGGGGA